MKSKMKYILIGLLLLSGFSNVRAQDALDKFRQEMGKLESLESEYHKVILERRIIRNIIQTVLESFFRRSGRKRGILRKRLSITTVR